MNYLSRNANFIFIISMLEMPMLRRTHFWGVSILIYSISLTSCWLFIHKYKTVNINQWCMKDYFVPHRSLILFYIYLSDLINNIVRADGTYSLIRDYGVLHSCTSWWDIHNYNTLYSIPYRYIYRVMNKDGTQNNL